MFNFPAEAGIGTSGDRGVPPFDFSGFQFGNRNPQEVGVSAMPAAMGGAASGYGMGGAASNPWLGAMGGQPSGAIGGGKPMEQPAPPPVMPPGNMAGGGKPQGPGMMA